jgi:hypothetical protein
MPFSVALLRKMDNTPPEIKEVLCLLLEEIEQQREAAVTQTDFNDLKQLVRELLAEAQKRTEQCMEELAEAQRETTRELASLSRAHDNK